MQRTTIGGADPSDPAGEGLAALGWDGFFEQGLAAWLAEAGRGPQGRLVRAGRVIEVRRGSFLVAAETEGGRLAEFEARPSGRLSGESASRAAWPATGDWVALRGSPAGAEPGGPREETLVVEAVLPRRSAFSRKATGDARYDKVEEQVIAANIDTAFIVTAAGHDFSPRRIERYAALALDSGAAPVLVVTKADLAGDAILDLVAAANEACPFAAAFGVCAPEGRGLEAFGRYLRPGSTSVLLGSSGSGKSTLLNALAGAELNATGAVKDYDQRGRHTTTTRTLFTLPGGAMVIDTPGLREVQLWLAEDAVGGVFSEIDEKAASCRFSDCGHEGEPGCAVKAGLEDGTISPERYESWLRLRREARFLETKTSVAARLAEKAKYKTRSKASKRLSRMRGET